MSTYNVSRLANPQVLHAIHRQSLIRLLAPHRAYLRTRGFVVPTLESKAELKYDALIKVLLTPDAETPPDLVNALYYVHEMSTERGMDLFLAELPTRDRPRGAQGTLFGTHEEAPADVAVRAWLHDPAMVQRKHAEMIAHRQQRFEYYQGCVHPPPAFAGPTAAQLGGFEKALDREFAARRRGEGVHVHVHRGAHDWFFLIRHGELLRREGAMKGRGTTGSVVYRPFRFDVVAYDPVAGTLRVHAKYRWETILYRRELGRHLFGDAEHFAGPGRYTLEPLAAGDPAAVSVDGARNLRVVHVTELHLAWRHSAFEEVEVRRASDVLEALRLRGATLPEGTRVVRATFELHVHGDDRPRTVTIIPPRVARYSREEDGREVDTWLGLRGFIRTPDQAGDNGGEGGEDDQRHDEAQMFLAVDGAGSRADGGTGPMARCCGRTGRGPSRSCGRRGRWPGGTPSSYPARSPRGRTGWSATARRPTTTSACVPTRPVQSGYGRRTWPFGQLTSAPWPDWSPRRWGSSPTPGGWPASRTRCGPGSPTRWRTRRRGCTCSPAPTRASWR